MFGSHRHSDTGDIVVLFCHMILQNHLTKGHMTQQAGADHG